MKQNIAVNIDPVSMTLMVLSLIGLTVSLHHMFPIPFVRLLKSIWVLLLMLGLFAAIMFAWYRPGGIELAAQATIKRANSMFLLIVGLVMVMGIGEVVTLWHRQDIIHVIERFPLIGTTIASFLAPTSNCLIPVVEVCWMRQPLQMWCVYFMQASALMSVPLFTLRSSGFETG